MKSRYQHVVIIGATSCIAEHCARIWAKQIQGQLVLVGRHLEKLQRIQADLQVRSPGVEISVVAGDFEQAEKIQALVETLCADTAIDLVLIAHGILPDQAQAQQDLPYAAQTLYLNALSPVLFAEGFARYMAERGHGQIALIGSVAGDRGRKSNYVYGAAKGLIERYAQGMQHRFAATPVAITLIKPGPTRTPMTAALAGNLSLADPQNVAQRIVKGIAEKKPVVYVPAKWWFIMKIIANVPRCVFNRMGI